MPVTAPCAARYPAVDVPAVLDLFVGANPVVALYDPGTLAATVPAGAVSSDCDSLLLLPESCVASLCRTGDIPAPPRDPDSHTGHDRLQRFLLDIQAACRSRVGVVAVVENHIARYLARLLRLLRLRASGQGAQDTQASKSGPGLAVLLKQLHGAGYSVLDICSIAPSVAEPFEISVVASQSGLFGQGLGPLQRLGRIVRGWLSPAYLVIGCGESARDASLLHEVLAKIDHRGAGLSTATGWTIGRIVSSPKQKSLIFARHGGRDVVVRLPHSDAAQRSEARTHRMLTILSEHGRIADRAPRPLLCDSVRGRPFYMESGLTGQPLSRSLNESNRGAYATEIRSILMALNPDLAAKNIQSLESHDFSVEVRSMAGRLLAAIPDDALRKRAWSLIDQALADIECRLGIVHGDFSVNNILTRDEKIIGVVDWEDAYECAPPILDMLNYMDSVQRACSRNWTIADTIPLLASGDWPNAAESNVLNELFDYCGADPRHRKSFAVLYWLFHVGPQLSFAPGETFTHTRIVEVLKRILPH